MTVPEDTGIERSKNFRNCFTKLRQYLLPCNQFQFTPKSVHPSYYIFDLQLSNQNRNCLPKPHCFITPHFRRASAVTIILAHHNSVKTTFPSKSWRRLHPCPIRTHFLSLPPLHPSTPSTHLAFGAATASVCSRRPCPCMSTATP